MSTDMAISLAKKFIRQISQPFDHTQTGISLWTLEDIEEKQRKEKEEANKAIQKLGGGGAEVNGIGNGGGDGQDGDVEMDYGGIDDEVMASLTVPG